MTEINKKRSRSRQYSAHDSYEALLTLTEIAEDTEKPKQAVYLRDLSDLCEKLQGTP